MASFEVSEEAKVMGEEDESRVGDGSVVDLDGGPASAIPIRKRSGKWVAGTFILLNQGLTTLAFFGVGENLVLYFTRVLQQSNATATNSVSRWRGTVYMFSLVGAILADSYWGRYKTCVVFQLIFIIGLMLLSLTTQLLLHKRPNACGVQVITSECKSHYYSTWKLSLFYISLYMIGVGKGGYQPNIATFGADQFDEKHPKESHSKVTFFSYFYLAFNLAALFSQTILGYFENQGMWALGFWVSTSSALAALILFLGGTKEYRHYYFNHHHSSSTSSSSSSSLSDVKCMFKLLPIWLCTIIYSVVYTQMDSLFVEQGDAMNTKISNFEIPPASMSCFNVLAVVVFVFLCNRMHKKMNSEIQRMGIGLVVAIASMISAGIVECYRLKYVKELSNLSIFWQAPQYALIGASEVFMYVAQLEFFNARAPDRFKSFGSALCMSSMSFGSYVSSYLVSIVMKISTKNNKLGWIPEDLNKGHLDRFYFLLAGLTAIDLVIYIVCANWYINAGKSGDDNQEQRYII